MDFVTALFLQPRLDHMIGACVIVLAFAAFAAITWYITADERKDIDAAYRKFDEHSNAGCANCGGCGKEARNAACDAVTLPPAISSSSMLDFRDAPPPSSFTKPSSFAQPSSFTKSNSEDAERIDRWNRTL